MQEDKQKDRKTKTHDTTVCIRRRTDKGTKCLTQTDLEAEKKTERARKIQKDRHSARVTDRKRIRHCGTVREAKRQRERYKDTKNSGDRKR